MMQLGFSIALTMQQSGGGGAPSAPIISGQAYDEPTNTITANVDQSGTAYWLFNLSATPLSAAYIIANAAGSAAVTSGINYLTADDSGRPAGTNYLHFTVLNATSQATDPGVVMAFTVVSRTFTETWASYTAGDVNAALISGGYTFGSAPPNASIVTDADGPAGKACSYVGTSADVRRFSRNDIAADLALGGWSAVDVLVKIKATSVVGARAAVGFAHSGSSASGLRVGVGSGPTTLIALNSEADPNSVAELSLETGISANAVRWCRFQFYNTNQIRAKIWAGALGDEPGAWSSDLAAASTWTATLTRIDIIARTTNNPNLLLLGYSVGIDVIAPGF